jgi:nucleoside-diphosphate-sugar epimerase
MKALVTGANGFLGRRIVRRLLDDGVAVRAFVRPGRGSHCLDTELFEGDLGDDAAIAAAVAGVDWVVHAAARVETTGSWEAFAEANIRGTRRLIRAAQAAGVRRIVHISSLSVYAVPRDGVTITENSPYESESSARGHYSRSKLAADRLALSEAARGAPVVVLRPGLLYGPSKRPPLARQSTTVAGVRLILASPDYTLPMSYVDNVADAVLLALTCADAVGQAFTVVDENVRQTDYLAAYRTASGEQWRSVFLPVSLVAAAALVIERGLRLARRRPPLTYHQVRRATDRAWYDCARAQRVLGWTPAVSLAEGLRRSFDALRDRPTATPGAALATGAAI